MFGVLMGGGGGGTPSRSRSGRGDVPRVASL